MKTYELRDLRVGDLFSFEGNAYIAFSLTPDPFEVYCLNINTKELEEIYEGEKVYLLDGAVIGNQTRGKELEVIY